MDPKILREAALAYQAVYNEDLREEIEEKQLALDILEEAGYYLISQGCTAVDVLEYFANVDNDIIIEDVIALSDGTLLSEEGVVSQEYIEEQTQQLDEIIGAALRLGGAALRAARFAPQGAKLGQRALAGLGGAGRAATRISQQGTRASAVVRPALGRAAQAVRGAVSGARGAVSGAVNKAKDIARGALNKLPGGSGGRLAGAAKMVGKAALGGAAFGAADTAARRALSGGPKPQTAKSAPTSGAPKPAGGAGNVNVPGKGERYYASSDKKYYKNYNDALAAKNSRRAAAAKPGSSATMNALNAPGVQNRFIQDKPASSSAPASRPAATAAPASRPAAPSASRPAATAPTSKPAPTAPAKPATGTLGSTSFERRTPTSAELKGAQAARAAGETDPEKVLQAAKAAGSKKPGSIVSGFDMFDAVKGYLIDEGFAETEEAATAIMANMSEEWRSEVIGEAEKWIQKAVEHPGAFTKKAKEYDMTPQEFAAYVDKHPEKFDTTTKKQANLAQTLKGIAKEEVEQVDEVVGLLARAAIPAISAGLGGLAVLRARQAAQSGVDAAKSGAKVKPGVGIANVAHGFQRQKQMLDQLR